MFLAGVRERKICGEKMLNVEHGLLAMSVGGKGSSHGMCIPSFMQNVWSLVNMVCSALEALTQKRGYVGTSARCSSKGLGLVRARWEFYIDVGTRNFFGCGGV